jgi:hypothetical protein
MQASLKSGKPSETRSYCLRVYPSSSQEEWMNTALRARQWAYNLGIKIYKGEWRDRYEQKSADPSCFTLVEALPPVKRLSGSAVSKYITRVLAEIKKVDAAWNKQIKWTNRFLAKLERYRIKNPDKDIAMPTQAELRVRYTKDPKTPENPKNPNCKWINRSDLAWLLEVPRSVLTQGVNDYQECLSAKFEDMKKPKRQRLGRGWPKIKALYECESFTVQLERPATSEHLKEQWARSRIPLGPENLGSVVYRDDLALPEKIPSLITYKRSASGRWHASFAVKVKEGRKFNNHARTLREDVKRVEREVLAKILEKEGDRAIGYDPNFAQLVMHDSKSLSIKITNPRQRREDKAKQSKLDRNASKTTQGIKPNKKWGKPGRAPSNRSKKAQQKAAKLREHGANITDDFQKKNSNILGQFYRQHHFEGTNHKALRKTKRKGNAFSWADTSPGRWMEIVRQKAAIFHEDAVFVTCASHFPSSQRCWSCRTINPQVKDGRADWTCRNLGCNITHNRDECAGINMLDEGFRISQNQDPNSQEQIDALASCFFVLATPLGERHCANQPADDFTLFEQALVARFERNQIPVQVRRFAYHAINPERNGARAGG